MSPDALSSKPLFKREARILKRFHSVTKVPITIIWYVTERNKANHSQGRLWQHAVCEARPEGNVAEERRRRVPMQIELTAYTATM